MSTLRDIWVICDECGCRSSTSGEHGLEARKIAIAAGWTHPGLGQDRCPQHPKTSRQGAAATTGKEQLW